MQVEELERRELLAAPTAAEQLFLERLNDARANPAAYGAAIGVDLSGVAPSQPLAFNEQLIDAALGHSEDMNANNYFGHIAPNGADPGARIAAAGFTANGWGESIAAGYATPDEALAGLITDAGVPDLGHRMQLLDMLPQYNNENLVGIGIVQNGTGTYSNYYTIDTAGTFTNQVYLTGSAFTNADHSGRYQIGEGLGNITITVAGVGSVQTYASGGYEIALNPGTYKVTASGPGLGTITTTVTIGSQNVRVDFTPQGNVGASMPIGPTSNTAGTVASHGSIIVTGADRGGQPVVNVYNAQTGQLETSFLAFASTFSGGVRVAVGDVNGDGTPDIICAAGPGGGPAVEVFDGKTFQLIKSFYAMSPTFTGGLFVAAGDISGAGYDDIITSADAGGGPQVTIWDGKSNNLVASFYATTPTFTGGIRVAAGDLYGTGYADVVAVAGPGGGPQVTIFNGQTLSIQSTFYAMAPNFTGGLYVAVGDLSGDGKADIITGADRGGGPQVTVFDGPTLSLLSSFYALAPNFTGGVRVGVADTTGSGSDDILTAAGPGGGPQVTSINPATWQTTSSFYAYSPSFTGGVFLGGQ